MSKSNSVHNRIMNAFPNLTKWADRELVIELLIDFFEGKKIRINEGWKQSCGHSSLIANSEGRHTLKVLKAVDVRVIFGNDAPRGGAVGQFFKCLRKNTTAVKFFSDLLNEVRAK